MNKVSWSKFISELLDQLGYLVCHGVVPDFSEGQNRVRHSKPDLPVPPTLGLVLSIFTDLQIILQLLIKQFL